MSNINDSNSCELSKIDLSSRHRTNSLNIFEKKKQVSNNKKCEILSNQALNTALLGTIKPSGASLSLLEHQQTSAANPNNKHHSRCSLPSNLINQYSDNPKSLYLNDDNILALTRDHSYSSAYLKSFLIDQNDPLRDSLFFIPNQPVIVKIFGHEQVSSLGVLHRTFYLINIRHGTYSWTIKRRYKNFLKLYEAFTLYKTKQNLRHVALNAHIPTNTTSHCNNDNNSNSNVNSKFKPSDHFKLIFQSIGSDFNQAKNILEKFLQDVVDHKVFRNHNETLKFLEVSHLSFISELGDKQKEGLIKKQSLKIGFCLNLFNFELFWDSRWLIIKDTWIGHLHARTGEIDQVILVDKSLKVSNGTENTGVKYGLLIENQSRSLIVKCYNEKRAHEWCMAILQMVYTTGHKFVCSQRFDSFAPIRQDSLVQWFVDASGYMESVADAIELAQEEIFITGFFLTPEVYLKRPVLVGDKWRLDKLLLQKAEEGVKIYILIYKEIEITLPINSAYTKRILGLSHRNIKVLRHPDHINEPNQFLAIMWAHHEKLVVVDQSVAYFGGIDLCYGRWDNHFHKLTDCGSVLPQISQVQIDVHAERLRDKEKNQSLVRLLNYKLNGESLGSLLKSDVHQKAVDMRKSIKKNLDEKKAKYRTMRMFSSPARPIENEFQDYFNKPFKSNKKVMIKDEPSNKKLITRASKKKPGTEKISEKFLKDFRVEREKNESEEENSSTSSLSDSEETPQAPKLIDKLDRFFKNNLKRSRSLDMSTDLRSKYELKSNECELVIGNKENTQNAFKMIKDSLNQKLKGDTQSLNLREYNEMPIFNKLKKIRRFKESLKRYTRGAHPSSTAAHCLDDSELNSSFDHTEDFQDKSENINSSEQIFNDLQGSSKYWIGKDYCNFIYKDVKEVSNPFRDYIDRSTTPRMPWHDVGGCVCGPAARDIARHFIQRWNYVKTKKKRNSKRYHLLVPKAYKTYSIPRFLASRCFTANVQVLRCISSWSGGLAKSESSIHNAMIHLITNAKHYIYIENQFFISNIDQNSVVENEIALSIYNRIVRAARDKENLKVYIFIPLIPGYEGEYGKASGVLLHAITHYNNSTINGLIKKLSEASIDALNYICFFSMRTWSELSNRLLTEIVYVHSKLLIVDDRACIIGSANINDRSLLGNRDSEVALHIEDNQMIDGVLNKKKCQVGRFTSSLRHRIFNEFLGEFSQISSPTVSQSPSLSNASLRKQLIDDHLRSMNNSLQTIDISDPCSDEFYKQTLLKYAAQNTRIYDLVFKVIPCDLVSNFDQLKEYQKQPGLSQSNFAEAQNELNKIKGYVVLYPNRFLCNEDLTPPLGTKEKLLPTILWT